MICFNCGSETTRQARLNDDLQINRDAPFRPVCYECGPKYKEVDDRCIKCRVNPRYYNTRTAKAYRLCSSCGWDALTQLIMEPEGKSNLTP